MTGNLKDRSLPDVLKAAELEGTSGVLRLKAAGPDGAQRGELVLRGGALVGAAIYRAGGVTGTGDALVEAALCSPEDAMAALQIAAARGDQAPDALREGAARAGVSYAFVVDVLRAHISVIARTLRDWQSGTFELVLPGFPAGEVDRDSAPARAFLLDEGMSVAEAFEQDAQESEKTPPQGVARPPDEAGESARDDVSKEITQAAPNTWDWGEAAEAPEFNAQGGDATAPTTSAEPDRDTARSVPAVAIPSPFAAPPEDAGAGTNKYPAASIDAWADLPTPDEKSAEAPSADAEVTPPPTPTPTPTPTPEPEPESPPSAGAEAPQAAAAEDAAPRTSADEDPPDDEDEPTEVEDGPDDGLAPGVDLSAPGFGESALMEAETLLDGEVLSVMLEMGNSAAAIAAETHVAATEAVRTGHLILVDEDGQLAAMLVPALREAGYVVHPVRGVSAAMEKIDQAAQGAELPLVLCDLLLARAEGGMLGGLDVARHAAGVPHAPPVVLLAETVSDDVRFRAESSRVGAILERPLKTEMKKSEAGRNAFIAQLLVAVDEHRPHAQWRVEGAQSEWTTGEATLDEGWDVDELERRADEVEDLPDFGIGDPATRRDALWRETMRELAHPLSPPEILLQILRFGAEVLTRGVLFTPTAKGELKGFGQFGVELAPEVDPDEAVRQIRFPLRGHPGVDRALDERLPARWQPGVSAWEEHLVRALGGVAPKEIFVGPVFCQGRLAALLYGDMLPSRDPIPDTTNLEVVLGQSGLALDRHQLEERVKALEKPTR